MKNLNLYIFIIIAITLTAGIVFYINSLGFYDSFLATLIPLTQPETRNKQVENTASLENFAKCLSEEEVKLYGTAWDGHTQNQKEIFGEAKKYLLYIECVEEEKEELTPECKAANIKSVPTWILTENRIIIGMTTLEVLSEFSGCPIK